MVNLPMPFPSCNDPGAQSRYLETGRSLLSDRRLVFDERDGRFDGRAGLLYSTVDLVKEAVGLFTRPHAGTLLKG